MILFAQSLWAHQMSTQKPRALNQCGVYMQVRIPSLRFLAAVFMASLLSATSHGQERSGDAAYQKQQAELVQDLWHRSDPLIDKKMKARFIKIEREFRQILNSGPLNARNKEILNDGLKYNVYLLTSAEKTPSEVAIEFQTLVSRLGRAGGAILNANNKKKFREAVCQMVATHAQELLKNNLLSRSLGLELLLNLEVVQPRGGDRIQMEDSIHKTYVAVLGDKEQPDAIKARAANCIKKYLEKANETPLVEMKMAEAMAGELKRSETEMAYQDTLLAALERIHTPRKLVGDREPVHLCVAAEVMQDNTRDLLVRCRAARILGRGAYDAQINFEPLAWGVAQLTLETGFRYRNAKDTDDPKWKRCGWYLYTAFHHEDRRDSNKGFLNRDKRSMVVSSGYEASVPVMAHLMFGNGPTPVNLLTAIDKWGKTTVPAQMQFDSACPPIKQAR